MSEDFVLNAEVRTEQGKGASRRLRRAGKVPMILYGGKDEPANLQVDEHELRHHLEHEAFYSHIIQVSVDGKKERAVLKDVQRHPAKPIVLHIDMMRVVAGVKIKVTVPFHFVGEDEAPGVKQQGGVFQRQLNDIEINVLPKDLPEFIEVDVSKMELDDTIHLADISFPEGVEVIALTHDENPSVISVHMPKVVEEPEEEVEAEEGEEGAEGEEAAAEDGEEASAEGDEEKKDEGGED